MNIAVLGCGGLGAVHADIYAKLEGVRLTGVCDVRQEMADVLSKRTGAPAYASFQHMLEEADIDAVSIALPTYLHKEYTLLAAKARKHVICEKPIALTLEDAEEMIACCEENGVRLFIGHVVRFFPDYANMKRALDEGSLGKSAVAHASRVGGHPGAAWYANIEQSGGVITDLMIHDLDFLRWCLGEVRSVYALNTRREGMDYALVTLEFENDAVANVEAHWGYPGPFHTKAEIAGSGGIIRADSLRSSSLTIRRTAGADKSGGIEIPQSPTFRSPYELQLEHFVACIRDSSEPLVTARDAYKALELAKAAYESVSSGKAVVIGKERVRA
ncbi:Gfo/Idh/MocA family oxidoreductase [Paenibacillus sp. LHD-117]|uniref:Gfo/Idh/MocA family protein n=1 Tax=Paenibacillus sp. LHD-117 TaxID=3071412 RepID=UPI0027DFEA01|nr:Gfo/Idh/MocA family oxidoreductase [Paenibacillus sp. LHD-117]MDQ6420654.1 Gfo/Idh/MocA family oxidoreductase [Paenibacillus sp. LHD-117]